MSRLTGSLCLPQPVRQATGSTVSLQVTTCMLHTGDKGLEGFLAHCHHCITHLYPNMAYVQSMYVLVHGTQVVAQFGAPGS